MPIDLTRITASLDFDARVKAAPYVYRVILDGRTVGHFSAMNLPQARGLARKALQEAFESRNNQSLIFDGLLPEGEVSRPDLRMALARTFAAAANFEG
jgi:hypothetical protein